MFSGEDGGEDEEQGCSCSGHEETGAEIVELGREDAGEPGQGGSTKRCRGKEGAEACVIPGAGEQKGHDEGIERSKAECAEKRQGGDTVRGYVRGEAEDDLGKDEECDADPIESSFAEEGHQDRDENAPGEFGYPEAKGDRRRVDGGVDADGIAG